MEERLEAAVSQVEVDGKKWHNIIHGDENTVVTTEMEMCRQLRNSLKIPCCGCQY